MNRTGIIANMYAYAVLPRMEELVRLDEEAAAIAQDLKMTIRFNINGGPLMQIRFDNGKAKASFGKAGKADVALFFTSSEQFNKMFKGGKVIPIPYKGLTRMKDIKAFTKLADILPKYLEPAEGDMDDADFMVKSVEMQLMVAAAASGQVAEHDKKYERTARKLKAGTILVDVENGPKLHIICDNGKLFAVNGGIENPTTIIWFKDLQTAAGLLSGSLDPNVAVGDTSIRLRGSVPLADHFTALMDRVAYYLQD